MKLDIPYYIRQVLREQRMVHIPGIGTFSLNQTSAKFNDDKTVISPPTLNISFENTISEDDCLLKYILDTGILTEAKAKKKIERFTQSAFNKLLNVDSFLIEGIGTITKKEGQDKVEFEPNVRDLTREFNDLIPLHLTPISRITEQSTLVQDADVKPQVEESSSFLLRILLLSLLFIALWFIGVYVYNSYSNEPEDNKTEILGLNDLEKEGAIAKSNEKELEQKYEEIDELIDPLYTKEGKQDDDTKEEEEEVNTDIITPKEELTNIETPIEALEAKSVEVVEKDEVSINKYADLIPKSGECIIIVGSFIKSLNAIKMVSLLERKGYEVYQSEHKGFKRVGLRYECANENLETYLQNIRKKISKRAWYLDPNLDITYLK